MLILMKVFVVFIIILNCWINANDPFEDFFGNARISEETRMHRQWIKKPIISDNNTTITDDTINKSEEETIMTTTVSSTTVDLSKSTEIIKKKDAILKSMSLHLVPDFLQAVLNDFYKKLLEEIRIQSLHLDSGELPLILNSTCTTACSALKIRSMLNFLLTIMEKYPELNNKPQLSGHLATELDHALDYILQNFNKMKNEINKLKVDLDFFKLRRHYLRIENYGSIIRVYLEWFENFAQFGKYNEDDIQKRIMSLVVAQQRYWLINVDDELPDGL